MALIGILTIAGLLVVAAGKAGDADPVVVRCEEGVPPEYQGGDARLSDEGQNAWIEARAGIYERFIRDGVTPSLLPTFEYSPREFAPVDLPFTTVEEALGDARVIFVGTAREQRFALGNYADGGQFPTIQTVVEGADGDTATFDSGWFADTCSFLDEGPLRIGNSLNSPTMKVGQRYAVFVDSQDPETGYLRPMSGYTFLLDGRDALVPISTEPEVEPLRGMPVADVQLRWVEAQQEDSN